MNVGDLYNLYPGVCLIHGITRIGVESYIPEDKSLLDRIKFSIVSSSSKLSTYSYDLGSMYFKEKCYGSIGLIIADGKIIYASEEDTGFTKLDLHHLVFDFEKVCWNDIFSAKNYNEIIVKNVIIRGFVIHYIHEFSFEEIVFACREMKLPIYINDSNGEYKEILVF